MACGAGCSRAIRGSTCPPATASTTITAAGTTILSVPFSALTRYVGRSAQARIDRAADRSLKAERERISAEYRALLGTEEERGAFDQMLGLCRLVFPFVEDHKFYCEHWFTTPVLPKIREFGALLARWGVLADAEDVFHAAALPGDRTGARRGQPGLGQPGLPPAGGAHWQPIVTERKRMLEKLKEWSPPPALGPVPERSTTRPCRCCGASPRRPFGRGLAA